MKVTTFLLDEAERWHTTKEETQDPDLLIYFGARQKIEEGALSKLALKWPNVPSLGCSSSGEILEDEVFDDTIVAMAIEFEHGKVQVEAVDASKLNDAKQAGQKLAQKFDQNDLKGVLVLSEGLNVNGSSLVDGLVDVLGPNLPIVGGLAGDGDKFIETIAGSGLQPKSGQIAAVGFYGPITIGHGSVGGWDVFGPLRTVTKSEGNILYELDGKPALDLYKKYLGDDAEGLPASALLFPLLVCPSEDESGVVRTILAVDEEKKSMTFAGDVPQGHVAQLMRANFDRIVDGAGTAARIASDMLHSGAKVAILVSCVGRKLMLGQRTADEVEAVLEILGDNVDPIGFYSYGEISPHVANGACQLHNQTMTITLISEEGPCTAS